MKVTETDLAELKGLILNSQKTIETRLTTIEGKIETISKDIVDLKVGQAKLDGDIRDLGEKTDGINKRLDSTEFINRGVFVGLILAVLGGLAKLLWDKPTT